MFGLQNYFWLLLTGFSIAFDVYKISLRKFRHKKLIKMPQDGKLVTDLVL